MRLKSLVLCSSSLAMAMIAAPAWAQETAQTGPVQTQDVPNDTDAAAPQQDDAVEGEGEEIVVTGIRRSLQSAQSLKRNSDQIVDGIVAEDIGKLPDLAVSETAARIPGVQVTRRFGEADQVLIRGLPDFSTTYNGREIFTAETRVVALQDFPSSNIAAIEIFKTTTANLVEAGLAGQVNVRSRRPFDFKGLEVAGSVWGLYTRQAGEVTPNANVLISNRWETGAGEFGALLNLSYTQLKFLDSEPSNTDFVADPEINGRRVRFPDIQRLFYAEGDRTRPSLNAAFQWRPTPGLEFYVDALYQGFRNKVSDRLLEVPLFGGTVSNVVLREGSTNLLQSATVTNSPGAIFSFAGGTFNKTDTYQFALGGSYDAGPLRISVDLARTDSTFTGSTESVDRTITGERTVDFDLRTPQFTIRNFDAADPANYRFDGLYEEAQVSEGDDYQARLDAEYETGFDFLPKIQAGVRYTDRDAHREFGNRFAGYRPQNIPITSLPLDFRLGREGFRGTDIQSGTGTFLVPTYRSIRENRLELRRFVIARPASFGFPLDGRGFTEDDPAPNPDSIFDANEKTLAGYAQLNFAYNDVVDAIVGLRAVRTETSINGTSLVQQTDPDGAGPRPAPAAVFTPVSAGQTYTDYLPNASVRFRVTPEIQFRLSATQTRTRPTFQQLNPSASLGAPPGVPSGSTNPFANARRGGGGNPFLDPFESNNYDASAEYYFSRNGFVSGAVFRRDLKGFIFDQTIRYIDPDLGPLEITAPENTRAGRIDGAEGQIQSVFDFDFLPDWMRGFGAQANFTYLDAEAEFPTNVRGEFALDRILGVSKFTYNLVGFYERDDLSVRLSYNKRGKFLSRRDVRGDPERPDDLYNETAFPAGRLDLSLNYTPVENFTVFFDWTNILNNPFRVNLSSARGGADRVEFVRFLRFEEQTFSLGARFRL